MTDMPKRIWAYIGPDGPSFGLERFKDKPHGVEYIRADNLPDFRELAERIVDLARQHDDSGSEDACWCDCCRVGDVTPKYLHGESIVEHILREAWEGSDD